MTTRVEHGASDATGAPTASAAALIATFYGRRDRVPPLAEALARSFGLPFSWVDPDTQTVLRSFDPPTAHDTAVVQLVLNEPGPAGPTWTTMRGRLEQILADDAALEAIWGYTLIYQADLAPGVAGERALAKLLPTVRRLHSERPASPQPLARADVAGGQLWLIDVPLQDEGLQAATVYVALGPPDPDNRLVREVVYGSIGPDAALLMPDLIAHKGYHQMRQYRRDDLVLRYRDKIEALGQTTERLLEDPTGASGPTGELKRLAGEYQSLASVVGFLDQLRIALARQVANANWWRERAGLGDVAEWHHSHLEMDLLEVELLIAEGERPLETTGTAVEVVRTELDRLRQDRQRLIQTLLTAIAAALAFSPMITPVAAGRLLELTGVPAPDGGHDTLLVLAAQGSVTLAMMLVVGFLAWFWHRR